MAFKQRVARVARKGRAGKRLLWSVAGVAAAIALGIACSDLGAHRDGAGSMSSTLGGGGSGSGSGSGSGDAGALPVRGFFQAPIQTAGTEQLLDTFVIPDTNNFNGQLFQVADGTGKTSLRIKENGGSPVTDIAPASFYVRPQVGQNASFRVVCSSEIAGTRVGPGPRGDVYGYDTTNFGSRVSCWTNKLGSTAWYRVDLASSHGDPAPKDAYWLFAMASNDADPAGTVDVAYLRDSRWEESMMSGAGRPASNGSFVQLLSVGSSGQPALGALTRDVYPDFTDFAAAMMPVSCTNHCGPIWAGTSYLDCGACSAGNLCDRGSCRPTSQGACVPRTTAEACEAGGDDGGPPLACGNWPDGCGGWITCPACQSPTVCGIEGDPRHCGVYPQPPSITRLRGSYQDTAYQLCGTFDDTAVTGVQVVMGTTCPLSTQTCQHNLCVPTTPPPPDDTPNLFADSGPLPPDGGVCEFIDGSGGDDSGDDSGESGCDLWDGGGDGP
jgi:hypothetical protein